MPDEMGQYNVLVRDAAQQERSNALSELCEQVQYEKYLIVSTLLIHDKHSRFVHAERLNTHSSFIL
jgi:hypothetical protein